MKLIIEIGNDSEENLTYATERVLYLIRQGFTSGYCPDWHIED